MNSIQSNKVDRDTTKDIDFHGRRIRNAGNSISSQDYVTRNELDNRIVDNVLVTTYKQFISFITGLATSIISPIRDSLTAIRFTKSDRKTDVMIMDTITPALVITSILSPAADSTTAFRLTKADKTTDVLVIDTSTPSTTLPKTTNVFGATLGDLYVGVDSTHKMRIVYVGGSNGAINTLNSGVYTPLNVDASALNLNGTSNGTVKFGVGNLGFWGSTEAAKQTLIAYTANNRSAAFTATPASLAAAATLADLNILRVAYENLRVSYEDLKTKLQTTTLVG